MSWSCTKFFFFIFVKDPLFSQGQNTFLLALLQNTRFCIINTHFQKENNCWTCIKTEEPRPIYFHTDNAYLPGHVQKTRIQSNKSLPLIHRNETFLYKFYSIYKNYVEENSTSKKRETFLC